MRGKKNIDYRILIDSARNSQSKNEEKCMGDSVEY